jgi:hypothetical protein
LERTPARPMPHQRGLRGRSVIVGLSAVALLGSATPSLAAKKAPADDRIEMPARKLPPTVAAKRALGAVYVDRIAVAFDVKIGGETAARVTGLVDLATSGADLRYFAFEDTGKLSTDPFLIRVRNSRIQIRFPAQVRQPGLDGYVTSIPEGALPGAGGAYGEVTVTIGTLLSLPMPPAVSSWKTVGTKPTLRGTATRTDFTIFREERYGSNANVEMRLQPSGALRDLSVTFDPVKAAKADGALPVQFVGTITRSAKQLELKPPTGDFVTADRLFDLGPVPETEPPLSSIDGDV